MRKYMWRMRGIQIYQWILIGVLLLSAFIRLYQSNVYIPFWKEQVDDMLSVRTIWRDMSSGNLQNLPIKGQMGTYRSSYLAPEESNPIYHGIAYYYLLLPAAVIAQFEPYGVVLFLILLGLCVVYMLYDAGVLLFGSRAVGVVAAFFGAISFWLSAYSRWIWTPSMVPFFSLLSLVSFLRVIGGKVIWWYPLILSMSLGSQVHDSGFVPLVFFGAALFFYKPSLPRGWFQLALLAIFAFVPIAPTVLTEVFENFRMVKALSHVAYTSLPTISSIGDGMWGFVKSALGVSILSELYIKAILEYVGSRIWPLALFTTWVGTGVYVLNTRFLNRKKMELEHVANGKYWPLVISWWLMCLPVAMFVEYLYVDQVINDFSRMNNMVFALPMFLLCFAYFCVRALQQRTFVWRVVVVVCIYIFTFLNMVVIRDYLWKHSEVDWAYKDLKTVSWMIAHHAKEDPYDLVVYKYHEGTYESPYTYEMLYFIELYPARMPETFNGVTTWGSTGESLMGRKASQKMFVVDKRYVGSRDLPKEAKLVDSTVRYNVYQMIYAKK